MSEHGEERRFDCMEPGCKSTFPNRNELIDHVRMHKGLLPFVCLMNDCDCGLAFRSFDTWKSHAKKDHNMDLKSNIF